MGIRENSKHDDEEEAIEPRTWGALLGQTKAFIEDDTTRVPTGFPTLDALLRGGFRPGHVAMLIGRTGVGKTAVATQMAVSAATQGWTVAYASLEMVREEMVVRSLSAHLGVEVGEAERLITKGEDERLLELRNMSIDDSNKPDWADLTKWVDQVEETVGDRPRLVVIDHLKLMGRYGYPRGEAERVAQLAEDAKAFAKRCDVALLVLHQVGRAAEGTDKKNHGHLPLTMESAMYGGEADADYVLGVYRPSLDPELEGEERRARRQEVYLQLVKNRHGQVDLDGIYLEWKLPSMRFEEAPLGEATYL